MKTLFKSAAYVVMVLGAFAAQADEKHFLAAVAAEQGRAAVAEARNQVEGELRASLRPLVARFGTGAFVQTALAAEVKVAEQPCSAAEQ